MRQQLALPLPAVGTTSPWFSGRVPRSQWEEMRGPLGDMPGAPFVYWYRESVNPFPKRQKGKPRGTAWRKLSKEPGFWVMPVYNLLIVAKAPVEADTVTMQLVRSEPVTTQSRPLLLALWKLVEHDWVRFRFVDNADEDVSRIEFAPWLEGDPRVSLLAEEYSTAASVAAFAKRFP